MPTNQEFLTQLATESPDKLKAWFDAEHNDNLAAEKVVSCDAAHSNDGNAHLKAHSKTEPILSEQSALLSEELDSREKLDADVRKWCGMYAYQADMVWVWLNRQAAITTNKLYEHYREELMRRDKRCNELQAQVDRLTAERDNLAADLLTCNREREQLRKHLGIALDHAHDICALVDIGD